MKTIEISTDDPVRMIRAIRDRHYEETKNMTHDERWEYDRKKIESFDKRMRQVDPADYDFPFLAKK